MCALHVEVRERDRTIVNLKTCSLCEMPAGINELAALSPLFKKYNVTYNKRFFSFLASTRVILFVVNRVDYAGLFFKPYNTADFFLAQTVGSCSSGFCTA